jgi:3-amino-4-hydroxybenzoic acid synthase
MGNMGTAEKAKQNQPAQTAPAPTPAAEAFDTADTVARRASVKLINVKAGTQSKRADGDGRHVWFDTVQLPTQRPDDGIFVRIINSSYSGIVVYLDNLATFLPAVPARMQVVLKLRDAKEVEAFRASPHFAQFQESGAAPVRVVASSDAAALRQLGNDGLHTCYVSYVDDRDSLLGAIADGVGFNFLWILFRDPTNIPLELVIASLQSTDTVLMKEIKDPGNVDDAIVSYGVMEYGAEGVIFSPREHHRLTDFLDRMAQVRHDSLPIQVGTVLESRPVGMGYRACIDTATLFAPDEGMLVGSTSQGGLLCCAEVFFLPYMELRPFRVNAGAVHSYVFNTDDRTDYMSELKAGSPVMIVNARGKVRQAAVGRVKIEQRPLRLIEVEFAGKERVNILMQDDWHVRIFSDKATPLNISELKPGDRVLGYVTEPGRHVGIKINESIIEK